MGITTYYPDPAERYVICTSSSRPGSPFNGLMIYETDTLRKYMWNGSIWQPEKSFVELVKSGSQSTTTGATAYVTWETELADTDGWHTGTSDTVTVPAGYTGWMQITATVRWASSATGYRFVWIEKNSATRHAATLLQATSGNVHIQQVSCIEECVGGDDYKIGTTQTAGTINIESTNNDTRLRILKIS